MKTLKPIGRRLRSFGGLYAGVLGIFALLALWPSAASAQVDLTLLSPATIDALPRGQATATYRIVNNGTVTVRVRTDVRAPAGWNSDALPQVAEVEPGKSDTVFVSLFVPSNATATAFPVEVSAIDDASGNVLQKFTMAISVGRVQSVTMVTDWPETASAAAGQTITQTFTLANLGNSSESLSITTRSSPDWPTTVNSSSLTLASGQTSQLTVTVAIPTDVVDTGDLHLLFVEARTAGTALDQPAIASVVNRTRVVLGSRDARVGPVYATFAGDLTHRLTVNSEGASYDTRLALVAPLGENKVATIEAQTPAISVGENRQFSEEHFRVGYDDLRRGFFHGGDISVDLDQPLLFYSRSGRGIDIETRTPGTAYRAFYLQDRFGLGLVSAGAQFRRRFDSQSALAISFNHQLEPKSIFRPESDQSNEGDAIVIYTPNSRTDMRAEVAISDSDLLGKGRAYRLYGRTADRGFYALGEIIGASRGFAGAYQDETQMRGDASLNLTSDLRAWGSYALNLENPGALGGEARQMSDNSRVGLDWNPLEDTQLRYSRLHEVRKDSITSPLGERRQEDSYEYAQRWGDFRIVLGADIGRRHDLDDDQYLATRRYRLSTTLDVPRGTVSLDYYRDLNEQLTGASSLREDYFLRTQLHIAKVQDLRADFRYSPGGAFGSSADLTAEWRLGQPERWRVTLNRNFGFGNETTVMAEFHQPVRMGFKAIAVGGIIAGRVYRLDNNAGLPNVRLIIDTRSILTDEDGNYSLRGLAPGDHTVDLDVATIGAGVSTDTAFPRVVQVTAGRTTNLDVPVLVSASISGLVTQLGSTDISPSQPVVGVVVELKPVAGGESKLRQTDGLGRYRFGEVEAGDYIILVRTSGMEEAMESNPAEANVTVNPGDQVTSTDFLLKPKPRDIQIMIDE